VECVRVQLVEDKYQENRKNECLDMSLSKLCECCYAVSP